eukprot:CAMPEP_0114517180 /NCGR_PEP_ID=MMETSP0109-20121206/17751_1 /TAXON_ID=29199 /ORGANISM="Chlorarachnion reptans, Strain CCCM449" /LENGTH=125 /DNA_ID=CAMNT_0001697673 /DNA_START=432 /DNA_END=806 /DNA_ORIENTATION=+
MSADAVLFRRGAERWIRQHDMSFGLGMEGNREYNLEEYRKKIRRKIFNSHGDQIVHSMMKLLGFLKFQKYGFGLKNNPDSKCINFYQHEGTFYPVEIMERFLAFIVNNGALNDLITTNYMAEEIW